MPTENKPADPKPTGLSQGWNLTRKNDGFVVGHQSVAYPPDEKAIERAERDGYVWVPFLVPAAQPQGDIETLRAALRTEVDAGDSWKRETLELREKLESQPRGEPVAYRYKELQQAWENEKPWELATVSLGRVYLERKELAERGVLVGKERETYLGLTIEPLYAEQPAPVAVASRDESIYWLKRIDGIGQARAELIYSMGFRRHTDAPQS